MESLIELLEKQPFFKGITRNNLELLVDCAVKKTAVKDSYIFKTGESAKKFYLINEGSVSLEVDVPENGKIEIQKLEPGEILGWSWQFPPYQWNFDARAIEDCSLIVFDTDCFFATCKVNLLMAYELQQKFSKLMLERLQATRKQIIEIKTASFSEQS